MVLFRETTHNNEFALIPRVTFSLVFVSMNKSQTPTQLPKPLVKWTIASNRQSVCMFEGWGLCPQLVFPCHICVFYFLLLLPVWVICPSGSLLCVWETLLLSLYLPVVLLRKVTVRHCLPLSLLVALIMWVLHPVGMVTQPWFACIFKCIYAALNRNAIG